MKRSSRGFASIAAAAVLAACSTTTASYLEEQGGYSVTKGRIVRIENLHSEKLEPLADGVAITLSQPSRVAIKFGQDQRRVMDLVAGAIVLCGSESDYVLQMAPETTTGTSDPR